MQPWHFAAFSNILFVTNLVSLTQPQSPDIGQNSDGGISYLRIFDQSLIKGNRHNSRTSDDINMKLWPVTKLDKRNKATSKEFIKDIISTTCDVIVIFPIYGQFEAVRIPDPGRLVNSMVKLASSLTVTFYLK